MGSTSPLHSAMPQPYAWMKLTNQGSANVSPRAGHSISSTSSGYILYGGMDGRRNDQGNPSPNSDLYLLKVAQARAFPLAVQLGRLRKQEQSPSSWARAPVWVKAVG